MVMISSFNGSLEQDNDIQDNQLKDDCMKDAAGRNKSGAEGLEAAMPSLSFCPWSKGRKGTQNKLELPFDTIQRHDRSTGFYNTLHCCRFSLDRLCLTAMKILEEQAGPAQNYL
jgi:hypothetical protein